MRILCLEQGDWVKPTDYPSNGRDWEARLFSDFAINPNRRARPTDYPINDANSPIKVVNFNGVGGSTIMYTAHYPRLHPSDFKVRSARRRRRRLAGRLRHARAVLRRERPHDGRLGPRRRSRPIRSISRRCRRCRSARPAQRFGTGDEQARLALVAVGLDDRHRRLRGPRRAASISAIARRAARRAPRPAPTSPIGRTAIRAGVELRTRCRVREITLDEHGMASGVDLLRRQGRGAVPAGRGGDRRLQRRRHAAPAAQLGVGPLSQRARQFDRPGRQEPDVPSLCPDLRLCRRAARRQSRPAALPVEPGILRDRPERATSCAATPSSSAAASASIMEAISARRRAACRGARIITRVYRRLLNHRIGLSAICEDLPEEHNRVTLDPVLKDFQRHPGAEDRLHDQREQPGDDGPRHRPREGGAGGRRRATNVGVRARS